MLMKLILISRDFFEFLFLSTNPKKHFCRSTVETLRARPSSFDSFEEIFSYLPL